MSELIRFGVSIDEQLLDQFDRLIGQKSYLNRSEAIRDLIRAALVDVMAGQDDAEMIGTVTLIYNHHVRDLSDRMTDLQHNHSERIVSVLHVHLDAHDCLEVLVVRGTAGVVRQIADELLGVKGVNHGKLVMTASGGELA